MQNEYLFHPDFLKAIIEAGNTYQLQKMLDFEREMGVEPAKSLIYTSMDGGYFALAVIKSKNAKLIALIQPFILADSSFGKTISELCADENNLLSYASSHADEAELGSIEPILEHAMKTQQRFLLNLSLHTAVNASNMPMVAFLLKTFASMVFSISDEYKTTAFQTFFKTISVEGVRNEIATLLTHYGAPLFNNHIITSIEEFNNSFVSKDARGSSSNTTTRFHNDPMYWHLLLREVLLLSHNDTEKFEMAKMMFLSLGPRISLPPEHDTDDLLLLLGHYDGTLRAAEDENKWAGLNYVRYLIKQLLDIDSNSIRNKLIAKAVTLGASVWGLVDLSIYHDKMADRHDDLFDEVYALTPRLIYIRDKCHESLAHILERCDMPGYKYECSIFQEDLYKACQKALAARNESVDLLLGLGITLGFLHVFSLTCINDKNTHGTLDTFALKFPAYLLRSILGRYPHVNEYENKDELINLTVELLTVYQPFFDSTEEKGAIDSKIDQLKGEKADVTAEVLAEALVLASKLIGQYQARKATLPANFQVNVSPEAQEILSRLTPPTPSESDLELGGIRRPVRSTWLPSLCGNTRRIPEDAVPLQQLSAHARGRKVGGCTIL